MLDTAENHLQLTLCANEAQAEALRAAGLRSIKIVTSAEEVCAPGDNGRMVVRPAFAPYGRFLLAYGRGDSDLRDAIAMRLGDVNCRWIAWPDQIRDAADLARNCSPEELSLAIEHAARPMWQDEVCLLSDVPDEQPQVAYKTGFAMLDNSRDRFFRLVRPAFVPVIGPYGSGKSVFLRQLACNLWRLHGWRTLLTAFEEKIRPRYVRDLRRHFLTRHPEQGKAGVEYSARTTFTDDELRQADQEIDKAFRFLRRKRGTMLDADRLVDRIEYAVQVYGVEVVIIDPVNEIDHVVPKGMSKTDYMGHFIMELKQLADDYNLLMIVAAHPPKADVAGRAKKLYTLNDGADTAHYGNKADIGLCIWRPGGTGATYLNIDKCKDTEVMGVPTLARLDYVGGGFRVGDVGEHVFEQIMGQSE